MNNTTSPKIPSGSLLIGLDWAKTKHDYCLLTPEGDFESGEVSQEDSALQRWLDQLQQRFAPRRLCVCLEAGRDALMWRLEKHEALDLFTVNPATAARYRKTFTLSGDKNDRRDAACILDLLRRHPEKVKVHRKTSTQARALHQLTLARRQTVNRRTGVISSLREVLELYYPVVCRLFTDLNRPIVLAFLNRWPDAVSLRKARRSTLVDFFHQHHSRSQERIERRIQQIRDCTALSEDGILLQTSRLRIRDHLKQIEVLNQSIEEYEHHIEQLYQAHERSEVFNNLPGAAQHLAPRLLAAFCLVQPKSAAEMQTLIGIAPIRIQSGKSTKTYMRQRCPKFLRQSFHEFAGCSVQNCSWAKDFFENQTKVKRKGAQAAKRALAYKWIRILFACWKQNQPYDDSRYLAALRKRNSASQKLVS